MKPASPSPAAGSAPDGEEPRPWTSHVLNTGAVFEALTAREQEVFRLVADGGAGQGAAKRTNYRFREAAEDNDRSGQSNKGGE